MFYGGFMKRIKFGYKSAFGNRLFCALLDSIFFNIHMQA